MNITWLGNASVLLQTGGEQLLFDPFAELIGGANPAVLDDFSGCSTIFATHGHFDHLYFVPDLMDGQDRTLFCTATPAGTVERYAEANDQIVSVRPGDTFRLGEVQVTVWKGSHIKSSLSYKLKKLCSLRILKYFRNARFIAYANRRFPENGETVCYEIRSEGKSVFVMGSLGLDPSVSYPTGMDVLILPFQGSDHLEEKAMDVIGRLRPRRIVLSHFDDAFPPLTENVPTTGLYRLITEKYPEIQTVRPSFKKTLTVR